MLFQHSSGSIDMQRFLRKQSWPFKNILASLIDVLIISLVYDDCRFTLAERKDKLGYQLSTVEINGPRILCLIL